MRQYLIDHPDTADEIDQKIRAQLLPKSADESQQAEIEPEAVKQA